MSNGYWVMVNAGLWDEPDRLTVPVSRWDEWHIERWCDGFRCSAPVAGPFETMDEALAFQHELGHTVYS